MAVMQWLVALVIVAVPLCSGLTNSEQRTLKRFDSKLASLQKSLDDLKAKVVSRKELIVKESSAQLDIFNERRINVTKIVKDHRIRVNKTILCLSLIHI